MKHFGDITKLSGWTLPIVDVITGGSPCQDLSVAGKRAGLDGERSGLFMEQIRIVKEMRERDRRENGRSGHLCRPRFMVWENVPGAFSSNKGRDFQAVLTEIVRIAEPGAPDVPMPERGGWSKSGCLYGELGSWSVAWRLHDAQYWGVPQRRKRNCVLADFGGLAAPEILFDPQLWRTTEDGEPIAPDRYSGTESRPEVQTQPESLPGDSSESEAQREGTPAVAGNSLETAGNRRIIIFDARVNGDGVTCQTLAGDHQNRVTDYTAILMTYSLQRSDERKESDKSHTLSARDYKDATDLIVYAPDISHALKSKANLQFREDGETYIVAAVDCRNGTVNPDIKGTLQAKEQCFNTNSNNVVLIWKGDIEDATARNSILRILRETYGTEKTIKWGLAILATLQQTDILRQGMHESCIQKQSENWRQLVNTAPPCEGIVTEWLLRDLRERQECGCSSSGWESAEQFKGEPTTSLPELPHKSPSTAEELFSMWEAGKGIGLLLQALSEIQKIWRSDGRQTRIIYPEVRRLTPLETCRLQGFPDGWLDIGDWTDDRGKLRKEADAPKYKAAGNSIALPWWSWLARRICAEYERPITMGSLFDGIGGFPLAFSRAGATPVWASEIEPFPIAVTKKHFPEEESK